MVDGSGPRSSVVKKGRLRDRLRSGRWVGGSAEARKVQSAAVAMTGGAEGSKSGGGSRTAIIILLLMYLIVDLTIMDFIIFLPFLYPKYNRLPSKSRHAQDCVLKTVFTLKALCDIGDEIEKKSEKREVIKIRMLRWMV